MCLWRSEQARVDTLLSSSKIRTHRRGIFNSAEGKDTDKRQGARTRQAFITKQNSSFGFIRSPQENCAFFSSLSMRIGCSGCVWKAGEEGFGGWEGRWDHGSIGWVLTNKFKPMAWMSHRENEHACFLFGKQRQMRRRPRTKKQYVWGGIGIGIYSCVFFLEL